MESKFGVSVPCCKEEEEVKNMFFKPFRQQSFNDWDNTLKNGL